MLVHSGVGRWVDGGVAAANHMHYWRYWRPFARGLTDAKPSQRCIGVGDVHFS